MEKNAHVKSKVIKGSQIPSMNSKLRKSMHKRNILRNKYQKGLVKWGVYWMQRYITTSQVTNFSERCDGGAKINNSGKPSSRFLSLNSPLVIISYLNYNRAGNL